MNFYIKSTKQKIFLNIRKIIIRSQRLFEIIEFFILKTQPRFNKYFNTS